MDYGKASNDNFEVKVWYDQEAENPREWDNLGTMICWHRQYDMGDSHSYSEPRDLLVSLILEYNDYSDEQLEKMSFERLYEIISKHYVLFPIYMYEHSGRTWSLSPFSCNWDSGQVGFIYASKDKIRNEFSVKKVTKKIKEKTEEIFKGELSNYEKWAEGQVYGLAVTDLKTGEEVVNENGFYGFSKFEGYNGMKECLNEEQFELLQQI
jgi:hypothetical protein